MAFSARRREVIAVRSPIDDGRLPRSSGFPKTSIFSVVKTMRSKNEQRTGTEHMSLVPTDAFQKVGTKLICSVPVRCSYGS